MTLAVEDANPKLVDVVAFADVDNRLVTADSLAITAVIRFVNNLTTTFQHSHSVQYVLFVNPVWK